MLKWVLAQPEALQKRAFVGYYMTFNDVSGGLWRLSSHLAKQG